MSLLPVAEALQRLENDGLVESKPRVGTRVRIPSTQDIRERYVVREALECQAARLFAEKASPQQRRELIRMADHMDVLFKRSASGDNDPEFLHAVHSFHFQLHMRIAECTGCGALCEAIERNQVLIFNWLFDVAARRRALPARFHQELARAITGTEPQLAEDAMRAHIQYGLEEIVYGIQLPSEAEWRFPRRDADTSSSTELHPDS
jgi:DNA-binding GntR family transcriptional regulator